MCLEVEDEMVWEQHLQVGSVAGRRICGQVDDEGVAAEKRCPLEVLCRGERSWQVQMLEPV